MIIKSIKLKDFISHADTELNFNPYETTVIVGPNGAGKTSIIDAILYALFGEKTRGETVKDIIRMGRNFAKVDLIFQESGREYRVIRTRDLKGNDARLMEGDNYLAVNKEITAEIEKIIGMDKEIAMSSIFVRQGEISKLLDDQPKERKNLIGRLVGLDKLEKSWGNIKLVISYFDDLSKKYDDFKIKLDDLRRERENIEEKIKENSLEKEIKIKDLADKEGEFDAVKNKYESLKQGKEQYHDLIASLKELNSRMNDKINQIGRLDKTLSEAENAKKEVERLKQDVWSIEYVERYVRLIRDKEDLARDKERLEKELREIESLKTEIDETKGYHDEFEILEKSEKELLSKKDSLNEDYNKITEINTKIGYLNKELDKKIKEKINLEAKTINLLTDVSIESKKRKIDELRLILDEIEANLNEIKTKEGEIRGRLHEINEYLEILGDKEACPVCKRPFQTEDERDIVKEDLEIEMERLSIEIDDYKRKKEELSIERDKANRYLDMVKNLEIERIDELKIEIDEIKTELKGLEEDKDRLKPILIEIEEINERLKETDSRLRYLKDFYNRHNAAKTSFKRYRGIDEVKTDIDRIIQKIESIKADIRAVVDIIGYEPKDGEEELKRLRKSKEEYDRLSSKVQEISAIKEELQRYKDEKEDLITRLNAIKDEIEKLAYSDEEFRKVEDRYYGLSKWISNLEGEIKQLDNIYNSYLKDLKAKDDTMIEIEEKVKEADRLKSFCRDLEEVKNAFSRDGVQREIRKRVAPLISESALSYLARFNLDIEYIDINEDFDIELWKHNGKVPIASISGGEKVAVAIAVRLAIANVLSGKISTIIMDEPTTNLDDERINELAEILSNFSSGIALKDLNVPAVQLIIVTHQEELENIADIIYRIEKENGVSYVKAIE